MSFESKSSLEKWYIGSNPPRGTSGNGGQNSGASAFGPRNMIQNQIKSLTRDVQKQTLMLRNAQMEHDAAQNANLKAIQEKNATLARETSQAAKAAASNVKMETEKLQALKSSLEATKAKIVISNTQVALEKFNMAQIQTLQRDIEAQKSQIARATEVHQKTQANVLKATAKQNEIAIKNAKIANANAFNELQLKIQGLNELNGRLASIQRLGGAAKVTEIISNFKLR